MSKTMAIVIIVFWISFGFISFLFNANTSIEYKSLVSNFQSQNNNPSLVDYYHLVTGTIKFFFQSMTLTLPNVPLFFTLFIILMQIMSALIIVWIILDDVGNLLGSIISKFF